MPLPTFLVIGAQKAGTTALYSHLQQHPDIFMSPAKEPMFLALEGSSLDYRGPADPLRDARFTTLDAYRGLFSGVGDERAIGEASTLYLYDRRAIDGIRRHIPDARLIALLRQPVDRAYSAFLFARRNGREPAASFEEALDLEPARIEQGWSPYWHYLQRGLYDRQLEPYFETFGQDRISIHLYDDLRNDPIGLAQHLYAFLGVDAAVIPDTSNRFNVSGEPRNRSVQRLIQRLNRPSPVKAALKRIVPRDLQLRLRFAVRARLQNMNIRRAEPLSSDLRAELTRRHFADDICRLQERLDRDLSGWLGEISCP